MQIRPYSIIYSYLVSTRSSIQIWVKIGPQHEIYWVRHSIVIQTDDIIPCLSADYFSLEESDKKTLTPPEKMCFADHFCMMRAKVLLIGSKLIANYKS